MINVSVYGGYELGELIERIINTLYNVVVPQLGGDTLNVINIIRDVNATESFNEEIVIEQYINEYKSGKKSIIIVPIDSYWGNNSLIMYLLTNGIDVNDIYLFDRAASLNFEHIEDAFTPFLSKGYLPYMEYHIADHCNMNCKACEHYSGLVDKPVFPEYEVFEKQFIRLKELVEDIGVIRILGGEPLLNKDIEKYVTLTRKMYPNSIIAVVTNAILLMQMPDSFYEKLIRENVMINISFYPPLEKKMPEIRDFLDKKGVKYSVSEMAEKFTMKQTLDRQKDASYFYRCLQSRCNNFYDGKLAACFLPFTTKYFNESFAGQLKQPLPEDGYIDIMRDDVTVEEIKRTLLTPFERCMYCTDAKEVDWEIIGKEKKISDWVQE